MTILGQQNSQQREITHQHPIHFGMLVIVQREMLFPHVVKSIIKRVHHWIICFYESSAKTLTDAKN